MQDIAVVPKFKNRDIDWLSFNFRVLQEAADHTNPVYERLKFLAIFSANLDEFFKVRVSRLRQIKKVEKKLRKRLAVKPNKTLKIILAIVEEQQEKFGDIYRLEILPELAQHGIHMISEEDFNTSQQAYGFEYFEETIKEQLTVYRSDHLNPISFKDGQLYLAVVLEDKEKLAFVTIPTDLLDRFVKLPSDTNAHCYTFLENIVAQNISKIFPEKTIQACYSIKISRDAELYLDDDYEGELAQQIYDSLAKRQAGQPTRLLYDKAMPKEILTNLRKQLGLGKVDMMPGGKHHNFSDFFGFPNPDQNSLFHYDPQPALPHLCFDREQNYFELIGRKDRIIHFPYQSFSYLQDWIIQAAKDPLVKSIKISLYRIAKKSDLTDALLTALENKKEVIIFVEAQARFDEENNLKWGKIFEENGAQVLYSIPNIKVHSKILLIEREAANEIIRYAYIGTGNFNAKTAKIYGDHGLFTANPSITGDLFQVFEVLQRKLILPKVTQLLVSPFNTRTKLIELIAREISHAHAGHSAKIILKMNSLEDEVMIDQLYRASAAGVQIRLIIRGFCRLVPEIAGLSENIVVSSIVDRYLEHGRIYVFHNKGEEKMYMGSADWMTRNLDKRIEVLTPILDTDVFKELKDILSLQLQDNVKARYLDQEATNAYIEPEKDQPKIRSQYAIYEYLKNLHTL
ncbi:MAG: polyphosphate kinase 1 [Saonia sp.]